MSWDSTSAGGSATDLIVGGRSLSGRLPLLSVLRDHRTRTFLRQDPFLPMCVAEHRIHLKQSILENPVLIDPAELDQMLKITRQIVLIIRELS